MSSRGSSLVRSSPFSCGPCLAEAIVSFWSRRSAFRLVHKSHGAGLKGVILNSAVKCKEVLNANSCFQHQAVCTILGLNHTNECFHIHWVPSISAMGLNISQRTWVLVQFHDQASLYCAFTEDIFYVSPQNEDGNRCFFLGTRALRLHEHQAQMIRFGVWRVSNHAFSLESEQLVFPCACASISMNELICHQSDGIHTLIMSP